MSFVIDQEALPSFSHPSPSINNLALDSNSYGKHPFDDKSAIFSTPKIWYYNSMFASSLIFVTQFLTCYIAWTAYLHFQSNTELLQNLLEITPVQLDTIFLELFDIHFLLCHPNCYLFYRSSET